MGIENLLKSLNGHDVRYVIIGATAFPVHGFSRATLDNEKSCKSRKGQGRPEDTFKIKRKIESIDKLSKAISKMKIENSNLQFSAKLSQNLKIIFYSKMLHISFLLTIIAHLDNRKQIGEGGVWAI